MNLMHKNESYPYPKQSLISFLVHICFQAGEAIHEALKSTTNNPHTHFLAFKLALVQGDTDKGILLMLNNSYE